MTMIEPSFALTRPIFVAGSHLLVEDLDTVCAFYRDAIGLRMIETAANGVVLGAGGRPLLTLTRRADAKRAPRNAPGLFHNAFLVPGRRDLAHWLAHAAEIGLALEGASDHLVSEAIYLSDPEGNGIEIYADRAPQAWVYQQDGSVEMATLALDLRRLYAEAPQQPFDRLADGSALGHIHLKTGALPAADSFYRDVIGLAVMARYPGASFFGAGRYHHHVAANIWQSRGAPARSTDMTGLADFTLGFNDPQARQAVLAAVAAQGIAVEDTGAGHAFKDPSGITVRLAG